MGLNKDRILTRLANKKNPQSYADNLYKMHHQLMKVYGWIPLDEFLSLPQQTVNDLIIEINKDSKEEKKQTDKMKRKK